jgi:aspartate carbamoyltransferase catalytic subunit
MKELSVNHLLGIKYINNSDIDLILRQPTILRKSLIVLLRRSLRYETLPLLIYFLKIAPGLSFELAQKIVCRCYQFSAAQSSVKKGETLIDTVNNILSMKVDMVVMRHANPGAAYFLSKM